MSLKKDRQTERKIRTGIKHIIWQRDKQKIDTSTFQNIIRWTHTGRKDVRQSILMPPKLTDRQRKNRNKYVLEYSMADRQTNKKHTETCLRILLHRQTNKKYVWKSSLILFLLWCEELHWTNLKNKSARLVFQLDSIKLFTIENNYKRLVRNTNF